MAKVAKEVHRLFLKMLNFTPELLAKTQEEAELQHASIDMLIRNAVEKHLEELKAAREADGETETREYAGYVLRAHFAEDRNEFLSENAIRSIGDPQRQP